MTIFNPALTQGKSPSKGYFCTKLYLLFMIALVLIMASPALAQTIVYGEIEGIYVGCPRKNVERCQVAVDEFRYFFPNEQVGSYIMLRPDKTGFMAPNTDRTWDLTWDRDQQGHLVMSFKDSRKDDMIFEINGSLLEDVEEGDLYYMAITDQEWSNPPKKKKRVKR